MTRPGDASALVDAFVVLKNTAGNLLGNTQAEDLEWLACCLFDASNLGVGDVRTIPWVIKEEEWRILRLERQALMGQGPRSWDHLTAEAQEAWRKLARICLWVLPSFCDRVGSRFAEQAKALEAVWRQESQRGREETT